MGKIEAEITEFRVGAMGTALEVFWHLKSRCKRWLADRSVLNPRVRTQPLGEPAPKKIRRSHAEAQMFTRYLLMGLIAFAIVFSFVRTLLEFVRYVKICGF